MCKIQNLVGSVFGKLTVIANTMKKTKNREYYWLCKCECGNLTESVSRHLKSGATITCGRCKTNSYHEDPCGYMVGSTATGGVFLFDKKHFEIIEPHNWWFNDQGYLLTTLKSSGKNIRQHVLIAQHIHGVGDRIDVDHINHIKHDNREENLRILTHQQNMFNQKHRCDTSSKYKGVSFHKETQKWRAYIKQNYKQIYLGLFDCEDEAAKKYNDKATELFGKFASLNEI